MGAKAWRGNGFYVHRPDNQMYCSWIMDGLGSTRLIHIITKEQKHHTTLGKSLYSIIV